MPEPIDLRFPIGRFLPAPSITVAQRQAAIDEIEALPARMREAVANLTDAQLDTPYRPGGWTVRQVVHHVPDSHVNAYIRLKFALTEDVPTIKPYDESVWAELPDSALSVDVSLAFLDGLHGRWTSLYRKMQPGQFARTFVHPEYPDGPKTLDWQLQLYAWHSRHHVAHITALRQRERW